VKGQTHKRVLEGHLQRELRRHPTEAETRLWHHLRRRQLRGCKFRRQHPFETFILDFVCLELGLVVELDGSQHLDSQRDSRRDQFLAEAGFTVMRFWNDSVLRDTEQVLEAIVNALDRRIALNHPHPSPPLEGEGDNSRNASNHPHPHPPLEGEGDEN
jgi:very-short-patch-repair endonuclease